MSRFLVVAVLLAGCVEAGPEGPRGERGERGVPGIPGAPAVRGELFVATSEQTDEPGSFVVAEVSCIDGRLVSGGCQWGKSPGEMLGHVSLPLEACDQAGEACELVGWRCAGASVGDEAAYVGVTALCETEGGAL